MIVFFSVEPLRIGKRLLAGCLTVPPKSQTLSGAYSKGSREVTSLSLRTSWRNGRIWAEVTICSWFLRGGRRWVLIVCVITGTGRVESVVGIQNIKSLQLSHSPLLSGVSGQCQDWPHRFSRLRMPDGSKTSRALLENKHQRSLGKSASLEHIEGH
jgi:hypothetical protein